MNENLKKPVKCTVVTMALLTVTIVTIINLLGGCEPTEEEIVTLKGKAPVVATCGSEYSDGLSIMLEIGNEEEADERDEFLICCTWDHYTLEDYTNAVVLVKHANARDESIEVTGHFEESYGVRIFRLHTISAMLNDERVTIYVK